MNCDQLFEVATSPPPCDEGTRREIDAHLAHCADCRRLVDAMSPALALFAEEEFAAGPPNSPGSSLTAQLAAGAQSSTAAATPAVDERARLRNALMSVAATLLVGMLLGGWLQRGDAPQSAVPTHVDHVALPATGDFQITPACLERDTHTSQARLICCTSCHAADKSPTSSTTSRVNLTSLLASCQICHEQ